MSQQHYPLLLLLMPLRVATPPHRLHVLAEQRKCEWQQTKPRRAANHSLWQCRHRAAAEAGELPRRGRSSVEVLWKAQRAAAGS